MENEKELQEVQTVFNEDGLDILCADDTIIENKEDNEIIETNEENVEVGE